MSIYHYHSYEFNGVNFKIKWRNEGCYFYHMNSIFGAFDVHRKKSILYFFHKFLNFFIHINHKKAYVEFVRNAFHNLIQRTVSTINNTYILLLEHQLLSKSFHYFHTLVSSYLPWVWASWVIWIWVPWIIWIQPYYFLNYSVNFGTKHDQPITG